ncbi:MAG TPA: HIT domain-containing protein [Chthonomonadaceae bacterium]|nr:HIT domain-containing protein [Chthonomonadaceae bacterium]
MTEQLWAPWRLKYIESAHKAEGCIFCDYPAQGEEQDAESLLVYRGPHAFIMLNAYPYSNGHLMVVPYRHTSRFTDYTDAEMLDVMHQIRLGIALLTTAFHPDGFNLGVNMGRVAGAGIADHLHWHIVPRWNGDTNFMPVLADVRVIPESLKSTFERLRAVLPAALEQTCPENGSHSSAGGLEQTGAANSKRG